MILSPLNTDWQQRSRLATLPLSAQIYISSARAAVLGVRLKSLKHNGGQTWLAQPLRQMAAKLARTDRNRAVILFMLSLPGYNEKIAQPRLICGEKKPLNFGLCDRQGHSVQVESRLRLQLSAFQSFIITSIHRDYFGPGGGRRICFDGLLADSEFRNLLRFNADWTGRGLFGCRGNSRRFSGMQRLGARLYFFPEIEIFLP